MNSKVLASLLTFLGFMALAAEASQFKIEARDTDLGVSDYQCPEGVFVAPHETQCELYYLCSAGGVPTHLYQCRDDLLYELQYNGCNFKELVDCGDRLPPFTCPSPNGNFPIKEGSCDSRYFVCTNGVHTVEKCPSGSFDAASSSCVATPCPTTTTVAVPTAPGPFECPSPNGSFSSPYSCSQYYVCVDGTAFLYNCPAGLYYNPPPFDYCDYPANVNCNLP